MCYIGLERIITVHPAGCLFNVCLCVYVIVQSINDELSASLATADELSREFSSLLSEATPVVQTTTSEVQNYLLPLNETYYATFYNMQYKSQVSPECVCEVSTQDTP